MLAAMVVAARLPFLLVSDRFFDSDEAVEGLMARHVLMGEFPALMWGQHYKGVPEIYLAAAVFAVFGSSVVALKGSTLAWFVAFVCVQFVLLESTASRRVAWLASLFAIAVPPVMVQWSMSGNAEFVVVLLAGSVVLLGWHRWQTTRSPGALAAAAFAAGFGLWAQQFILYYVIALLVTAVLHVQAPVARTRALFQAHEASRAVGMLVWLLLLASALYAVLGSAAFAGGFVTTLGGVTISATHPQKLWRISAALLAVAAVTCWIAGGGLRERTRRRAWVGAAIAFLAGNAPAIAHRVATGRSGPMAAMTLEGMGDAMGPIATLLVPTIVGFRSGTTAPLDVPVWTLGVILVALAASCVVRQRAQLTVFHIFAVTTPVLFLASGAFVDAQSYRYLLPLFGAIPVLLALGVDVVWRWQRAAAVALAVTVAAVFAWQQVAWYRVIHPDIETSLLLDCIRERGVRHAYAEYWLSYKLTFLTSEQVIVAQTPRPDQVPRYPPYQAVVRAYEPVPTLIHLPQGIPEPMCADVGL